MNMQLYILCSKYAKKNLFYLNENKPNHGQIRQPINLDLRKKTYKQYKS